MHAENQGGGWGGLALSTVLFRYVTLDTEETCRRAFDVAKPRDEDVVAASLQAFIDWLLSGGQFIFVKSALGS